MDPRPFHVFNNIVFDMNKAGGWDKIAGLIKRAASGKYSNIAILNGFTTTEAVVGSYNFYVGYLVAGGDGSLYFTSSPIALSIAN